MVATRWLATKREGSLGSYDTGFELSTPKRKQIATDGQKSAVESTYGRSPQPIFGRTKNESEPRQVQLLSAGFKLGGD